MAHSLYKVVRDHFINVEGVSEHRYGMAVHDLEPVRFAQCENLRYVAADARQQAILALSVAPTGLSPCQFRREARKLCDSVNGYLLPIEKATFENEFLLEVGEFAELHLLRS